MAQELTLGLLWFDDDPKRPLPSKIQAAAQRYLEKFGQRPDTCYVHPNALSQGKFSLDGIKVVASPLVQPDCLLVGIREKSQ